MEFKLDSSRYTKEMDYGTIPIEALSSRTRKLLNDKLGDVKQLVSRDNYQRDYRGLCDLMEIKAPPNSICEDLMKKLFQDWRKNHMSSKSEICVATFLQYLEIIDRFDVYDDCIEFIQADCLSYLNAPFGNQDGEDIDTPSIVTIEDVKSCNMGHGLAEYDAILLYDDADMDWATQIYSKLISNGFNVCNRDNSFVVNGQFEHDAFSQVIDRCRRVILLLSPEFLKNRLFHPLIQYAQANHIVHKVKSLIIPIFCRSGNLDLSMLGFLQYCVKLSPHQFAHNMDVFWDKLYYSVSGVSKNPMPSARRSPSAPAETSLATALPSYLPPTTTALPSYLPPTANALPSYHSCSPLPSETAEIRSPECAPVESGSGAIEDASAHSTCEQALLVGRSEKLSLSLLAGVRSVRRALKSRVKNKKQQALC